MSFRNWLAPRATLPVVAVICAACFIAQVPTAAAQTASVQFTVAVPEVPAQMQTYKLTAAPAPLEFLNEKLAAVKLPALQLEQKLYVTRGTTGPAAQDRVRAYIEPQSGDTHFIPNVAELVAPTAPTERIAIENIQRVARAALTDVRFIPKDLTELRYADTITIMGSSTQYAPATPRKEKEPATALEKAPAGAMDMAVPAQLPARVVMTIVPAVRYASGLPVYGLGSHAVVTVANDGSIVGALRRWRTASLGDTIPTTMTADQVKADIARQLGPLVASRDTKATVDKISLAYYDGNANYLQPVAYFEATVDSGNPQISPIRVAGYVPLGKVLEPIPDLAAKATGPAPATPKQMSSLEPRNAASGPGAPGDISLGEYINQNWPNDGGYTSMANSFLSGITFLDSIFPGWTPPVTRTQYYVAYPWEVDSPSSKYYLNDVNVAYTVPHGDWWLNTTLSNYGDLWYVNNIGTGGNPGFGAGTGGVLATWLIMSCEVIPSYYDLQNEIGGTGNGNAAFTPWWPVFQGLHNVIGFRTIMFYPDDNLQWAFGYDASLGGDITSAWFDELAAYDGNDGTYASQHLIGNPQVHYDRGSTIVDSRDLGQSIFSVGAQTPSSTLWNFWEGN